MIKIFSIIILTIFFVSKANAEPNALLAEAIKYNLSINDNLPTEDRLSAYKEIFKLIDEIITDHPASDLTIQLLTNQDMGNFDQNVIRSNYIKELTSYYDTVCEVTPNYSCLGFVSLSEGQNACLIADDARSIVEAHQNLKNAVKVFSSQESDESFITISLDQYRSCLSSSSFKYSEYVSDFFKVDLIKMLLNLDKEKTSRAMIENLKTPEFKVASVLALNESQGKDLDQKYFDRLLQFIDEDVEDIDGSVGQSRLLLAKHALDRGNFKINSDMIWELTDSGDFGYYSNNCDTFYLKNIVDKILDTHVSIVNLDKSRRDFGKNAISTTLNKFAKWSVLKSCYEDFQLEYNLTVELHGQILLLSKEKAKIFREGVMEKDWSSYEQIEFTIETLANFEELFLAEYGLIQEAKGSDIIELEKLVRRDERALFPVFKVIVDFGNVCEASKILFQQIKGKNIYDDAIEYMINSKNIDITTKHECGDSELELLLG